MNRVYRPVQPGLCGDLRQWFVFAYVVFGLLGWLVTPAWAVLPPQPVIDGLQEMAGPPAIPGSVLWGRITLAVGEVRRIFGKNFQTVGIAGGELAMGDVLLTGEAGRLRIRLEGGNVLQIGANTLAQLDGDAKALSMVVWRGSVLAYGFPSILANQPELGFRISHGTLLFYSGKVGFSVQASGEDTQVWAFKESVAWQNEKKAMHLLAPGLTTFVSSWESKKAPLAPAAEMTFSWENNPEGPLVMAGLQAYEQKDYERTIALLSRVQAVFPFNSLVAHFLGLAYMEKGAVAEAIGQWQRFQRLDPQGARANNIGQYLTLLMSKQLEMEIQEMLAAEATLSQKSPEPKSLVVAPFTNKGSSKFGIMAKGLTALIIADLAKIPGMRVLDRERMQRLINEIKLAKSGLGDVNSSVRAGRLLRAEKLVTGDYSVD